MSKLVELPNGNYVDVEEIVAMKQIPVTSRSYNTQPKLEIYLSSSQLFYVETSEPYTLAAKLAKLKNSFWRKLFNIF